MSDAAHQKVYCIGHYTLIALAVAWSVLAMYLLYENTIHPTPLLPSCPTVKEAKP